VSAVGADSGETILSGASSPVTTTAANQTVNLTWKGSIGSYSYNVWRCDTAKPCVAPDGVSDPRITGPWFRVALHVKGTSYSDTSASPEHYTPPQVTGTGSTLMNSTGLYSPFFQAPPITVSQLPAAAAENAGQIRRVTDSTTISAEGQICAGKGSAAALAFSNGTAWKCF
jgi:hypothetical protein